MATKEEIFTVIFVSVIWAVKVQCLSNCYTFSGQMSGGEGDNGIRVSLGESFGMGCQATVKPFYDFTENGPDIYGKNCVVKHQNALTGQITVCVANENGAPCPQDDRIVFEKIVLMSGSEYEVQYSSANEVNKVFKTSTTACMLSIQYAKPGDLGIWTMSQQSFGSAPLVSTYSKLISSGYISHNTYLPIF